MQPTLLKSFLSSLSDNAFDMLPIILVIGFFQLVAIRKPLPHWHSTVAGFVLVVFGLSLFILGLEVGVFPLGSEMTRQLTSPEFLFKGKTGIADVLALQADPTTYSWVFIFAFMVGFTTTLAEPSVIAIALKAKEVTTGAVSAWGLRISVALGVAFGVTLGTYRIVVGTPLHIYILVGYIVLLLQTRKAPHYIVPLAYDAGGVTTSTVTVPLFLALGIGLASNIPGRSLLLDGFGLIALASLFPIMTVLAYAMIGQWLAKRNADQQTVNSNQPNPHAIQSHHRPSE